MIDTFWSSLGSPLAAALAFGALNAMLTVRLKLDHLVAGLALNRVASRLTLFWFRAYSKERSAPAFESLRPMDVPSPRDVPVLRPIANGLHPQTLIGVLMVPAIWWFLERTRPGLELRRLCETPEVLDRRGLDVVYGRSSRCCLAAP